MNFVQSTLCRKVLYFPRQQHSQYSPRCISDRPLFDRRRASVQAQCADLRPHNPLFDPCLFDIATLSLEASVLCAPAILPVVLAVKHLSEALAACRGSSSWGAMAGLLDTVYSVSLSPTF